LASQSLTTMQSGVECARDLLWRSRTKLLLAGCLLAKSSDSSSHLKSLAPEIPEFPS
jgi:hypothetical protein